MPKIDEKQGTTDSDKIAKQIHYPDCWDTSTYPTLSDALYELAGCVGCSECNQGGKRPDADQHPNDQPVDCREAFERWFVDKYGNKPAIYDTGEYIDHTTRGKFSAWQAALAIKRECPGCNGYREVGGFTNADNGYETGPCVICTPKRESSGWQKACEIAWKALQEIKAHQLSLSPKEGAHSSVFKIADRAWFDSQVVSPKDPNAPAIATTEIEDGK